MEAPGQLLKHYSPYLPCYYCTDPSTIQKLKDKKIALISFSPDFDEVKNDVDYYLESKMIETVPEQESEKFCSKEEHCLMKNLYSHLREAENLPVNLIVLGWKSEKVGTVWDKIFRATEGKELSV